MISLYRGELHKVSGVPRQWVIPESSIPLSVFKKALLKKNDALLKELRTSSSPERLLFPNSPGPISGESGRGHVNSGEAEKAGVVPSGNCDVGIHRLEPLGEENKTLTRHAKSGESSELVAAENEEWHGRNRNKQEGNREEIEKQIVKAEVERENDDDPEKSTDARDTAAGSEVMVIDAVDQSQEMECDILAVEKTGMEIDEEFSEQGRVRVSETGETGTIVGADGESSKGTGLSDPSIERAENSADLSKNGDQTGLEARENSLPALVDSTPGANVKSPKDFSKKTEAGDVVDVKENEKNARKRKREELQAKLEKLTADKHHLVLMLKQVLSVEESKKRVTTTNASQQGLPGMSGAGDSPAVSSFGEKLGLQISGDLEEGELEYARTPSPPPRPIQSSHSSHNVLGPPPPMVTNLGRQNTLTQHISQGSSGRGGYYVQATGITPSTVGTGIAGGGALSPGAVYMGNLPSPLGPHNYSHNMALQHATLHAQKIVPVPPGHGQFSPIPPNGPPLGAGPGVAGGPPGFGGYVVPPTLHPHHPHLSQTAASSTSHIPVQQGVVSTSLLTTPRGPVGYHEMRLGGNSWIPR
ncbi:hypothetical protein MPTK1_4g06250 [Marchantia polymorpha subsp. ruderalis]|uniref:Uncharacterized protein n=2 Tax=Marchantia polymorpha TaxID=3197 RepID=A0A176WHL9_MARPO|nr:hypothetical protein AXG93_1838s1050 [Marchantia polymorpha subsp. ruderalis]PTQ31208.1 hypothetical protein MARPO_0114s0028 [Marchantia polymorpha]BBN07764.1 hypothetical protein Mp_4g06250 [Marchantia polymorpha subsp. ruderalis]|eukprot:PTQ31208.1 hypothetical protein MARPO_0114s0028 [Marchantia polymorpha]